MPGFNPTNAISNSRRLDIVPLFKEFAKVTEIQIAAKGNIGFLSTPKDLLWQASGLQQKPNRN
jgi:hypothetical protein